MVRAMFAMQHSALDIIAQQISTARFYTGDKMAKALFLKNTWRKLQGMVIKMLTSWRAALILMIPALTLITHSEQASHSILFGLILLEEVQMEISSFKAGLLICCLPGCFSKIPLPQVAA